MVLGIAAASCGNRAPIAEPAPANALVKSADPVTPPSTSASASSVGLTPVTPSACPDRMRLVDTTFCSDARRTCLDDEYSSSNKITICHRFAEGPARCVGDERHLRFCMDEYEYPNQKGARSPVMVDFHDAMALCGERGKRLCWEGEWTAACEGSKKTPFPYGYVRSKETCNIDNPWIRPSLERFYDPDPKVAHPELTRLDQGVASGSKPGCKSDFEISDQTGNVDEWVMLERKRGKGGFAGLKGGAWGHVRNACRPVTTSHAAEFTYYFVSFRCCADAKPDGADHWKPPPLPPSSKSIERASRGFTPPLR